MSRGRTITLTEREVEAVRAAMALWEAEYEVAEEYPGPLAERARSWAALERVYSKLADQSPAVRRARRNRAP